MNCNGLSMEFDVFEWAEGGNNEFTHHLPGRVRYPYLQLSAGMTDDKAMQEWFWKTREKAELKEVTVELHDPGRHHRARPGASPTPSPSAGPARPSRPPATTSPRNPSTSPTPG